MLWDPVSAASPRQNRYAVDPKAYLEINKLNANYELIF